MFCFISKYAKQTPQTEHLYSLFVRTTYHLERSASPSGGLCRLRERPEIKPVPGQTPPWQGPYKQQSQHSHNQNIINKFDIYLRRLSLDVNVPLLDESFHVLFTEVSSLRPAVTVKHSKVEDAIRHFRDLKTVFILLPSTNERGAADLGQANFRNGLPIANAGWQQNGFINSIVPDAKSIPSGGAPAAVRIKSGIAVAIFRWAVQWSLRDCELWVAARQGRSYCSLNDIPVTDMWTTAPDQAHKKGCWHPPDSAITREAPAAGTDTMPSEKRKK